MLKIKKINKKNILIILIISLSLFYCSKKNYQLMEPELFVKTLEKEISINYYFSDSLPTENYLRAVKVLEPKVENLSSLNAKDYFIELLRQQNKKDYDVAENFYRKALYELLKPLKGRNIYIVPSTIQLLKDPNNSAGVGIVLYEEDIGKFFILDVIEGSPAHLAEIKASQYLQMVDNKPINEYFLEDVVSRIKGKPKTKIELTIQGNHYSLYRSTYQFVPIRKTAWNINNKNILYFQIRFAMNGVAEQLKQLLLENLNPDIVVLDIRYLSQGNLEEILKIADLFIPKKTLIKLHKKNQESEVFSSTDDIYFSGKLFVLHQYKATPFTYALARLLENAPNIKILGPTDEIDVFIGKEVSLQEDINYGAFYFTNGYVEFLEPSDLSKWIPMENFISTYPPGSKPNLDDPYHKKIVELLK